MPVRHVRLPSRDAVRLVLAPALVFIIAALDRGYQTELWQHLARGRLIWQERAVVSVDTFTFTVPGRPLRDNNWLSQLLYYGLHAAGGVNLVQLVNALALAATLAGLVALCRRAASSTAIAAAVGVCAVLGLWQTLLVRPQTFSMLLFVALNGLLLGARQRPRLLALTVPLMALWANVHGGFAIGLALLVAFTAAAAWQRLRRDPTAGRFRPWPAALLSCAAATRLNPYGWRVYEYAGSLSALGVARGIEEWFPPSPATLVGAAFILSVAVAATLAVLAWRRLTALDLLVLGCFAAPAFLSVRMTVWWFLAAAPIAARLAGALRTAPTTEDPARRPSLAAAVALLVITAVCVGSLPGLERWSPLFGAARAPHRTEWDVAVAADALPAVARDESRVFVRMEWANFLTWQSAGRAPVFVEGHVELYPDETWAEYVTVNDGRPGWEGVFDRYNVRFLLIDQTYHGALLSEVRRSGAWSPRAAAGPALLFERRVGPRGVAGAAEPVGGGIDF